MTNYNYPSNKNVARSMVGSLAILAGIGALLFGGEAAISEATRPLSTAEQFLDKKGMSDATHVDTVHKIGFFGLQGCTRKDVVRFDFETSDGKAVSVCQSLLGPQHLG